MAAVSVFVNSIQTEQILRRFAVYLGDDHKGFVVGSSVNLDFKIARIRLG